MAQSQDQQSYIVVTDRGGHLHNALMLVKQLGNPPTAMVTTLGPDIDALKKDISVVSSNVYQLPHLFTWFGKKRVLNPLKCFSHVWRSLRVAWRLRGIPVISLGASNVVVFCYCARIFGSTIYHVECMNQVLNPSITARILYPILKKCYVQWEELLPAFGPKAVYAGWVL